MVRSAILDKARFTLVLDGRMINKGPTVQDRTIRVKRAMVKSLPEVVSTIEEEQYNQENPEVDAELKKKALDDFRPKSSDTHRSDKKRRSVKSMEVPVRLYKRKEYLKSKKYLRVKELVLFNIDVSEEEIVATFRSKIGIEETVTITMSSVVCTCTDHDKNYFCSEIVNIFQLLNANHLVHKFNFTDEEFSLLKAKSKTLVVEPRKKKMMWKIQKLKRRIKCSSCKNPIIADNLVGFSGKLRFHPYRICLPMDISKDVQIVCNLTNSERKDLNKNGIKC